MNVEDVLEVIRLEKIYKEKFNDKFPRDYYNISSIKVRKRLLEEAISSETELKDLDYIRSLHLSNLRERINDNIEESLKNKQK